MDQQVLNKTPLLKPDRAIVAYHKEKQKVSEEKTTQREENATQQEPSNSSDWKTKLGLILRDLWKDNFGGFVFLIGLVLLVIGALGKIPILRIDVSTQAAITIKIGVGLMMLGGLIWFFDKKNSGTKFRLLRTILPVAGVALGAFVLAVHYKIIPSKWFIGSELDDAVVALAVATLCGFLPAFLSADMLDDVSTTIKQQAEKLVNQEKGLVNNVKRASDEVIKSLPETIDAQLSKVEQNQHAFLEQLKISEERMVRRVEDATRTMLEGFNAVFDKALFMMGHAEKELIFVNFAMNFGSAHQYNPAICQKYKDDHQGEFSDAVDEFLRLLHQRIISIPIVKILTIKNDSSLRNFFLPLSTRKGYDELRIKMNIEHEAGIAARNEIQSAINQPTARLRSQNDKRLVDADSLPIQLLITKLKDENGILRSGCLVFMVGSDMLHAGLEPGGEPAFYTELDDMVGVFRNLALALIQAADKPKN